MACSRDGASPRAPCRAGLSNIRLHHRLVAGNERLQAADTVITDDAARIANTTRVTLHAWIAIGRAIEQGLARRVLDLAAAAP